MSAKLGVPPRDHAPVFCLSYGKALTRDAQTFVLGSEQAQLVCTTLPWSYRTACAASLAWKHHRNPRNGSGTACTFDNATNTLTYNAKG